MEFCSTREYKDAIIEYKEYKDSNHGHRLIES